MNYSPIVLLGAALLSAQCPGLIEQASAQSPIGVTKSNAGVAEVIVVFKTHFDIGYTDMASNVVTKYRTTMMDQALSVVDQNRDLPPEQQFVWTMAGWPLHKIMESWPGQATDRKVRITQAFRDGRFVVHALPFTTHTELLEPEDLVRGLRFSSDLCRQNGKPLPRDAKMTDVPSHSWIMPTLLKRAGVDFLHLGCNAASSSPRVPRLFWWEGLDGSRLLTMYTAESYGTGLMPPSDWPYRTWLALIHTGDNHGPPTPQELTKLLADAAKKLPGIKVRIGRLSDFADAILAGKPAIPVVRGDMPDTWIHGPMADPRGASLARRLRPALASAEILGTQLKAWGIASPDLSLTLRQAYENSLLYGEHTWGGQSMWMYGKYMLRFGEAWAADRAAGRFQRIEGSWDEHTAYIERVQALIVPAQATQMRALAHAVSVEGPRVVVFNPLPWKRGGLVSARVEGEFNSVIDVANGKTLPLSLGPQGEAGFLAQDVPASGYKTYQLSSRTARVAKAGKGKVSGNSIETRFFKAIVDPARGVLSSLVDRTTGRELVDPHAPQGFGQYLYERFDRDQVGAFVKAYVKISADWGINELGKPSMPPASEVPYRAKSPTNFSLRLLPTAMGVTAVLTAPAGPELSHGVTTKFILYDNLPYLDVELSVEGKPFDAWPEAGWLCLPFQIAEPQFRLARLGGIADPAADFVEGCNFDQVALNGGLSLLGKSGLGVGVCAMDSPVVSLGAPGGWKYTQKWTPRPGRAYFNLFNNQWTTNFRLWNSGTWTSRVRIWAFRKYSPEKTLITPSLEARSPLQAGFALGAAGTLKPEQAGLSVSARGVYVTAFAPDAGGQGTLLRLWDFAGEEGICKVVLPAGVKASAAQPVNLRGEALDKSILVKAGVFKYRQERFAPASFLLLP